MPVRRFAPIVLLAVMAWQLILAALHDSATFDEPTNVRAGLVYVADGNLGTNSEHPPLTKALEGLAVALARGDVRRELTSFPVEHTPVGDRADAGDARAQADVRLARIPTVVLTLLFGVVVFLLARDLFGDLAGVVALATYSLSPQVLAHGHLATNDLAAAGFLLTTLWCLLRAHTRGRRWVIAAGLALGAGLATKYQVTLYSFAVLGAVVWSAGTPRRALRWSAAVLGTALGFVWLLTLVIDPGALFHAAGASRPWLPLPAVYRAGLQFQVAYADAGRPAFVLGQTYLGHRWWYQPLLLTMKVPLLTLALWLLAMAVLLRHRRTPTALALGALVVAPATLVLALGMAGGANIGDRYVLGVPVLLAVAAGGVFAPDGLRVLAARGRRVAAAAVVVVTLSATAVAAQGHEIAYVNAAWGGTAQGYRRVADSAYDWGQDLGRLASWADRQRPYRHVYVAYFGRASVSALSARLVPVAVTQVPALRGVTVAVSATYYDLYRPSLARLGAPFGRVGTILLFHAPVSGSPGSGCADRDAAAPGVRPARSPRRPRCVRASP